jgi:CRISPR-associated protein Cas5d
MKVERVSYDVMTPSAARGILEAIYWKPEIRWHVDRIHVIRPIRFMNVRRNEVASVIPANSVSAAMKAGSGDIAQYADEDRQQRASIVLRDVVYVIEAHFDLVGTPQDRSRTEELAKHYAIVKRRMSAGQCFHQPYFGTREFPADFSWVERHEDIPHSELAEPERDLGYMLLDIDHGASRTPRFFRAVLKQGVMDVPPLTSEGVMS